MIRPAFCLLALGMAAPAEAQTFTSVPSAVLQQIGTLLPERSNAGAAYVSDAYDANITVAETCTVDVVLIWEGAGYQNSLGYFTWRQLPSGAFEILSADLIEQNVSFPLIATGDRYTLKDGTGTPRQFQAGEKIGFFVVADGNRRSSLVQNWSYSPPGVPSLDGLANRAVGRGLYTTLSGTNPEFALGSPGLSRHVATVWMPPAPGFLDDEPYLLYAFEDLDRTRNSDDDFNDLVFVATATPLSAISGSGAFQYLPGDPDGDGVLGANDHYPNDSSRAYRSRYPSIGRNVIAFEDNYPDVGDADYNDAVVAYSFETTTNALGQITDVVGEFALVARGAAYEHGFGVHIPGIPNDAAGTLRVERHLGGAVPIVETDPQVSVSDLMFLQSRRIVVFPSTQAALPPSAGTPFSNTLFGTDPVNAGTAKFVLSFTTPVDPAVLGSVPFDPYLYLQRFGNGIWDIHLPGKPAFADRSTHLPSESGLTFIDGQGFPWALEVPNDWRFPMERVDVEDAYADFSLWRTSAGAASPDWYIRPDSAAGRVGDPLSDLVPSTTFAIEVGG